MRNLGCVLLVLGVGLACTALVFWGVTIKKATDARRAVTLPLQLDVKATTPTAKIDTDKFSQVAVQAEIHSDKVEKKENMDHETEYNLKYDFPVEYRVLDEQGHVVYTEKTSFAWNGGFRTSTRSDITEKGGSSVIEHGFEKFKVPPPGRVSVEILVQPDTQYKSEARDVQLIVYDNVSKHVQDIMAGILFVIGGGIVALVGGILLIVYWSRGARPPAAVR